MTQIPAFSRITVEPGKCAGKPCIRGMRITVRRVLEILATYPDRDQLFADYPFLEEQDLQQALAYAASAVDDDTSIFPLDLLAVSYLTSAPAKTESSLHLDMSARAKTMRDCGTKSLKVSNIPAINLCFARLKATGGYQ